MSSHIGDWDWSQHSSNKQVSPLYSFKSGRFIIAFLLMLCFYVTVSNRSHIGYAMVCMVNATAVQEIDDDPLDLPKSWLKGYKNLSNWELIFVEPKCRKIVAKQMRAAPDEMESGYRGTLIWTPEKQSILISASYVGNILVMFFSGYVADFYGPKKVAFFGVLGMTITAFMTPAAAYLSFYAVVIVRGIGGMFENPVLPACAALVSRWYPKNEKSRVAALYTSGNQLASSLGVMIASTLCQAHLFNGWPMIFYLTGTFGVIWMILWQFMAEDDPNQSRIVSEVEKKYLNEQLGKNHASFLELKESGNFKFPLRKMLTSPATFAIVVGQFSFNFTNTILSMYLPSYSRDVLYLNIRENGLVTSILFFVQLFSKNLLSSISDNLKKREILTATQSAKIFQGLSNYGGALLIFTLAYFGDCTRFYLVVCVLGIFGFCFGGAIPGSFTCCLSIAPLYTGMIMSLTIIAGSLGSLLAPTLVGFLVQQGNRYEWRTVFYVIAGLNVVCGLLFTIFASAEVQPWAKVPEAPPPKAKRSISGLFFIEYPDNNRGSKRSYIAR